jgi:hypothetical protein
LRAINETAPGIVPLAISFFMAGAMRASRSAENP